MQQLLLKNDCLKLRVAGKILHSDIVAVNFPSWLRVYMKHLDFYAEHKLFHVKTIYS